MDTVIYIINRLFFSKLSGKILYEIWTGYKFIFLYIRIFGSSVYLYISELKRIKMDFRSEKLLFVGYADDFKVYKLFNFKIKKVSYARSVIIYEAALSNIIYFRTGDSAESGGDVLDADDVNEVDGEIISGVDDVS